MENGGESISHSGMGFMELAGLSDWKIARCRALESDYREYKLSLWYHHQQKLAFRVHKSTEITLDRAPNQDYLDGIEAWKLNHNEKNQLGCIDTGGTQMNKTRGTRRGSPPERRRNSIFVDTDRSTTAAHCRRRHRRRSCCCRGARSVILSILKDVVRRGGSRRCFEPRGVMIAGHTRRQDPSLITGR